MNTTIDATPRPRMIGGEMYPDLTDEGGRAVDGSLLAALCAGRAPDGGRVLVAGTHPDRFVRSLVESGARVSWLLRSFPRAAATAAAHPDVDVLCGSVTKLDADGEFDLVVAADGLDRLCSVEGDQLSWAQVTARLTRLLADDGGLLLRQDNPLSVDRLIRLDGDDPLELVDAPQSREHLLRRLGAAELTPRLDWAAFGETVLLDEAAPALRDADPSALASLVTAAVTPPFGAPTVARDPAPLVRVAANTGALTSMATSWLVYATRGTRDVADGPVLAVGDHAAATHRLAYRIGPAAEVAVIDAGPGTAVDGIGRDLAAVGTATRQAGTPLESVLLTACRRGDRATIVRMLRGYVDWLRASADADGTLTGATALAGLDNAVADADTWRVRDASWTATDPVPVPVAVARGLYGLVTRLVTGGHPHPWSARVDAKSLLAMVAGAAGVRVDEETRLAAIDLEVRFRAIAHDLSDDDAAMLRDRLCRMRFDHPPVTVEGYRELRWAWLRQGEAVTSLGEQSEWDQQILASRDLAIAKLEAELDLYRAGFFGRVVKLLRLVAVAARNDARKVFRKAKQLRKRGDET